MTIKYKLAVAMITAMAILAIGILLIPTTASYSVQAENKEPPKPKLTHAQELWLSVLEWCESRGNPEAINPEDNDGTPSYGAFQFKPTTLDYYAEKYGVPTTTLMNYETQKAVVTQMILHRDEINWHQQFPACVRKHGLPPKK